MNLKTLQSLNDFLVWRYELNKDGKKTKRPYSARDCYPVCTEEKDRYRLTTYAAALKTAAEGKPNVTRHK